MLLGCQGLKDLPGLVSGSPFALVLLVYQNALFFVIADTSSRFWRQCARGMRDYDLQG
jgi:hypothetical protein